MPGFLSTRSCRMRSTHRPSVRDQPDKQRCKGSTDPVQISGSKCWIMSS